MLNRDNLVSLVQIATDPSQPLRERHQAFAALVTEFQDMAFGSAYALLGDYASAEDAAQDAFIAAWQNLNQVRDTRAFPGWLRQIVASQCHRRLRRNRLPTIPLEDALSLPMAPSEGPHEQALRRGEARNVHAALEALPETERQVTILFYISDYSQKEIAAFTGISVVGIRKRLASARRRLKERILREMQEDLIEVRPSHDAAFAVRVTAFTKLFSALIAEGVSLVRSFTQLAQQETNLDFRAVIEDINQEIQAGSCLSRAMAKHPRFFSETYVQAIREGELKGVLDVVLERLANGTYVHGAVPAHSQEANHAQENMQVLVHLAGHSRTEAEHALLGLLMSGENQALHYLKRRGISTWKLKWELQQHLAALPKGQPWQGFSDSLQKVRQIESSEAEKDGTIVIETLYLLLGLTAVEDTLSSHLLRGAGVTFESIRVFIAGERAIETAVKASD
ncbi:MAG: sigma-70 family RNA polymerase sigma factor [Armatimonadota bacterium]